MTTFPTQTIIVATTTTKEILIDLPSQSIHFGKLGRKLAAGVGSGAETATGSRSETGY
ncbi:hypothetical protein IEO21_06680 [Rhodonia placenta]|uniref:Uncharacterized protein n=1 Tax=Rhodonia placenta TaxID=104341 RepID=A0A8H7NZL0_9APHY|nr:hypothetical protein IEO21_06680 [Postia placenta]